MNYVHALNYFTQELPLKEFYINSCGYFSEIDRETRTARLNGRDDYQIICVVKGEMWVKSANELITVKKGQAIVFKPHEPQIYGTVCHENGAYYWIHFSGTHAEPMLDFCSMNGGVFDVYAAESDTDFIIDMMSEINIKPPCYQLRLFSIFTRLLTELNRRRNSDVKNLLAFDKIRPAISAMQRGSSEFCSITDYAKLCRMSESYFLHSFKEIMGKSPMQYRNTIIMEKTKSLLRNTDLSVKEIAESVGVSNSMYLCKKFKLAFGCTPTEYRNRHKSK